MAVVAIYSTKGGVGKTTFATSLAWCSSAISRRHTLLWDLDPSGGSAFMYGIEPRKKRAASALFSMDAAPAKLVRPTEFAKLDVLPADESLRALDSQLLKIGKAKRIAKLTDGLAKNYDRIILDTPPVMNEVSAQVIRAADLVIVPLPPSPLSHRAFDQVVGEVKGAGKKHPPILPVLSMIDMRRSLHRDARKDHADWPVIPLASAIEQSAVRQRPVGSFDPRSPAAKAFSQLWTAIERKLAARS